MSINEIEIPTFESAMAAVKSGSANALEVFVYENEPCGEEETAYFRDQLVSLIEFVTRPAVDASAGG